MQKGHESSVMKWVIYLLLLVNLAFGLWHFRSQDTAEVSRTETDDTLNLVLLKEYLAKQDTSQEPAAEPDKQSEVDRCFTLGPFKTKKAASVVRDQMVAVGIQASRRLDKNNTRQGFWVLLPPEASRVLAKKHIKELKKKGIKDYFLVVTGEQTNAVSLGVFSMSESAQRRYKQMKKLGFDAKMQQVDLPLREYWLDWPQDQKLLPEVLEKFRKGHSGIGQTERNCSIE